jgi:N-acetylglucosamine-6-phosphate deacetylase
MMYYLTELQTRPDGVVNSTITARSSLATGLAFFYQRAAVAVTTTDYPAVALTLQDQYGEIIKNERFDTQYEERGE